MQKTKKILLVNLVIQGLVKHYQVSFEGQNFEVTEHQVGYDYDTAEALIKALDGQYDVIGLSGVVRKLTAGQTQFNFPGYLKLIRASIRTPVCVMDQTRDFFCFWSLERFVAERPHFFKNKRVLFHSAIVSPLVNKISAQGATVLAGDPSVYLNLPYLIRGPRMLANFLKTLYYSHKVKDLLKSNKKFQFNGERTSKLFLEKSNEFDVFVTLRNLIENLTDFSFLKGKILFCDGLEPALAEKIKQAGVQMIITAMPESLNTVFPYQLPLTLLTALLHLTKKEQNKSYMDEDEYLLHWVQKHNISPNPIVYEQSEESHETLRCAFVIHPLSAKQLWSQPGLKWVNHLPKTIQKSAEKAIAHLPFHYHGEISGVVSKANGKKVSCDLLVINGTPRELIKMNEGILYKKLIQCAEYANQNGSKMMGLGAYTKVAGDGGITVAQNSPIPVTTGNSFSSASTLWSARVAFEKIRPDLKRNSDGLFPIRAMVIGATGSIGRVTSMLLAEHVSELILAATQSNKLLELQNDIQLRMPQCKIRITMNSDLEVGNADLIVTTTSNRGRKLLNVQKIKSGAVVCDVSRPLDFTREDVLSRPDVLFIESGEIVLPGDVKISRPIGLPGNYAYACLAETILLTLEGRYEAFSFSRVISPEKVKEIYKLGKKHGFELSPLRGPAGLITSEQLDSIALIHQASLPGLKVKLSSPVEAPESLVQRS